MTKTRRKPSTRSAIVTRRTYNRPLNAEGTAFETWPMTVDRVISHQRWLWERAKGGPLTEAQEAELEELRELFLDRKASVAGRTNWLGGTDVAKTREASQFNCAFSVVETVHDVVDGFWLLLQGCGVGARAYNGTLNGFAKAPETIDVIRSKRTLADWEMGNLGREENRAEYGRGPDGRINSFYLSVGDSAEAWAKSVGKLLALKEPIDKLVLDFSEIRAPGIRLRGYGWISSGDETLSRALVEIALILSRRAGQLLVKEDINDIINWLGTTLSSRRSAESLLMDITDPEAQTFALRKKNFWEGNIQREQSNNSVVFWQRPSRIELRGVFDLMREGGGSEPGFVNGEQARRRAPWFRGLNPCFEILLGNKSFCNLVETNLSAFNGDTSGLMRAHELIARANYRQTCVNLDDGVLQRTWHELNQFLRLCGVGVTGIVAWEHHRSADWWAMLRDAAVRGAHMMADELGLPRSKLITTVKPSGTLSKLMDSTEGAHKPLGRYIFNWITLSNHDPLVSILQEAGYRTMPKPFSPDSTIVCIPVEYPDVDFDTVWRDGELLYINTESAVDQLERYKMLMDHYVDHNCSITVSYSPEEVPEIIDWLYENWDSYVGVAFLYRNDPSKTAADLGYPYLPQEVVTKSQYDEYVKTLSPIDLDAANSFAELEDDECATGACPVR